MDLVKICDTTMEEAIRIWQEGVKNGWIEEIHLAARAACEKEKGEVDDYVVNIAVRRAVEFLVDNP